MHDLLVTDVFVGDVVSCVTLQTSKRFYPFLPFVGTGTGKTVSLSPSLSLGAPGCVCMHVCMVYVCLYVCLLLCTMSFSCNKWAN